MLLLLLLLIMLLFSSYFCGRGTSTSQWYCFRCNWCYCCYSSWSCGCLVHPSVNVVHQQVSDIVFVVTAVVGAVTDVVVTDHLLFSSSFCWRGTPTGQWYCFCCNWCCCWSCGCLVHPSVNVVHQQASDIVFVVTAVVGAVTDVVANDHLLLSSSFCWRGTPTGQCSSRYTGKRGPQK